MTIYLKKICEIIEAPPPPIHNNLVESIYLKNVPKQECISNFQF